MKLGRLTLKSVRVRAVSVPLARPVVSKVGRFEEWPMILIDLEDRRGNRRRSYLEPYLKHAARYIVPAIHDLAQARKGHAGAGRSTTSRAGASR
jgi:mandelate racemase